MNRRCGWHRRRWVIAIAATMSAIAFACITSAQKIGKVQQLFSAEVGRATIVSRFGEAVPVVIPADSSMFPDPAPQNKPFIWVSADEENQFPGYKRVIGGSHTDGTTLYICRATWLKIPGKLYKDLCQVPWAGKEQVWGATDAHGQVQVFLTNSQYHWKAAHDLSHAQIQNGAVSAGWDPVAKSDLYFCRMRLKDGLHPGKYLIARGLCYVSWGGGEQYWPDGFDVLFP